MKQDSSRPPAHAALVHDLSGFGRCSLTVALPVLSVMGVHASCLPTAVLSTHTGGFHGCTFRDLTADMRPFYQHWQREGFRFDALYTGYLGSAEQIAIVSDFLTAFHTENTVTLVDPVMGDHGKLYSRFTPEMAAGMKRLCAQADIIVPNVTEAALLTGMEYREEGHDQEYIAALCQALAALCPGSAVVTGVMPAPGRMGAAWSGPSGAVEMYAPPRVDAQYDGTGDLFASVLLGAVLRGRSLAGAVRLAADFTRQCVAQSAACHTDPHHGVDFEPLLWRLGRAAQEEAPEARGGNGFLSAE